MFNLAKKVVVGAALLVGVAFPAVAADLYEPPVYDPPPPQIEYRDVQYGGWYIRGDLDYSLLRFKGADYTTRGFTRNCCGQITDSFLVGGNELSGKLRASYSVGAGVGYKISRYLRADLTFDYQSRSKFEGRTVGCGGGCVSTDLSSMTALSLLANAYVDVGTWYGFTPYVGAGIGGAQVKWDSLRNTSCQVNGPCDPTLTHKGYADMRFAYAAMAGVSYEITSNLALDVGYRYMRVSGGRMFGFDNAAGGPYTGNGRDKGLDFHSVKAGLRYQFGGSTAVEQPVYVPPSYEEPQPIVYK